MVSTTTRGQGSSPLTRGKLHGLGAREFLERFIPAHAGKTLGRLRRSFPRRAHPRSRGENWSDVTTPAAPAGSSPLTRGKHQATDLARERPGLIPAHTGKTTRTRAQPPHSRAHPHSQALGGVQYSQGGLIPAHAGKTVRTRARRASVRAHPRSRGENTLRQGSGPLMRGSSPLTRGKPAVGGDVPRGQGLIPAHAGKTERVGASLSLHPAHPRSRGENTSAALSTIIAQGSSPLTRGKPRSHGLPARSIGLIPAHAGKTRLAMASV